MNGLIKAVQFAPENATEFPETADMPDDVIKWMLFDRRREGSHVPEYWEARQKFASAFIERGPS